ncbi:MAG: DUF1295 domain-containing protein [Saprospiraceae bacterium]|nr:DUF1295 domain-containing protein [Saprospiraceae bacterium]
MELAEWYSILLKTEFIFAAVTFVSLFFISAPYGRFGRKGWGMTLPAKYAWMIMEAPAMLLPLYFFFAFADQQDIVLIIFLVIWQFHYAHRTLIYPLQKSGGKRPFPLVLVLMAIVFNSMNGIIISYSILIKNTYTQDWLFQWPFMLGLLIFAMGYWINKQSDAILKHLRSSTETSYKIPYGGWFRWVSNPHYLGEIIEWCGWAILTWSVAGWAFVAYTFANLAPRAWAHHKWYKANFEDYPSDRKALIPFIW